MAYRRLFGRRWPTALLLALAALAIGAVFGTSHTGNAAIAVKPTNVNPPVISGNANEGSTLTTSDGTWSGTAPFTFTYQWSRCDTNGKSCAAISGATNNTYLLQHVDLGNTLIVTVVAKNSDGTDTQPSKATDVVTTAPAATGCPSGTGVIQIADLSSPASLLIGQQTVIPGVITPAAKSIQANFHITACGGRPVQGALVYGTAVPFNQYSIAPEATTGADGVATLTMNQLTGFPAARHQQLLVMFVRARKSGDPLQGGVSARLLVSFRVSLH